MKTSQWITSVLALTLVSAGAFAFSSHAANAQKSARPAARTRMNLKEQLNLTQAQQKEIRTLLKAERPTITTLLGQLRDARSGLREAIQSENASESSVRVASAKVAAVEADVAVERLKLRGKILPILTDEQRAKLSESRAQVDDVIERRLNRTRESRTD